MQKEKKQKYQEMISIEETKTKRNRRQTIQTRRKPCLFCGRAICVTQS